MEQASQKMPDLSFDVVNSGYDPLSDFDADGEDTTDQSGQQGPCIDPQAKIFYAPKADDRSAEQRIEDLFVTLAPRRRVLLDILRFLDVPQRSDALDEKVKELQKNDLSVYSGYNFSALLDEAGAIQKENEDGSVFDEEKEQLPDIIEIDGAKFFRPTNGKQVFWRITEAGRDYLEKENPLGLLTELYSKEPQYQTLYKELLEFCGNERGRSAEELSDLIDNDPLVQSPRKYFSYFVKRLEDCSALVWAEGWKTTAVGKEALEIFSCSSVEEHLKEKNNN